MRDKTSTILNAVLLIINIILIAYLILLYPLKSPTPQSLLKYNTLEFAKCNNRYYAITVLKYSLRILMLLTIIAITGLTILKYMTEKIKKSHSPAQSGPWSLFLKLMDQIEVLSRLKDLGTAAHDAYSSLVSYFNTDEPIYLKVLVIAFFGFLTIFLVCACLLYFIILLSQLQGYLINYRLKCKVNNCNYCTAAVKKLKKRKHINTQRPCSSTRFQHSRFLSRLLVLKDNLLIELQIFNLLHLKHNKLRHKIELSLRLWQNYFFTFMVLKTPCYDIESIAKEQDSFYGYNYLIKKITITEKEKIAKLNILIKERTLIYVDYFSKITRTKIKSSYVSDRIQNNIRTLF